MIAINDENACTHYYTYNNNFLCRGIPDLRQVSTTADAGIDSLRDAINVIRIRSGESYLISTD